MTLGIRATIAAYLIVMLVPLTAHAWDRGDVDTFATLPPGERHPEGIAADSTGNIYVTTFDVTHGGRPGQLFVLGVAGSSNLLLGLDFHPTTHELLVIDFGSADVRRVDPFTGTSSVFMTVTGSAGLNALTFDSAGNVYVSDSFQEDHLEDRARWRGHDVGIQPTPDDHRRPWLRRQRPGSARARGRLEVYGTSVMRAKRSAREQPGFEAVASGWRSSFRWFALMTVAPTVSVASV